MSYDCRKFSELHKVASENPCTVLSDVVLDVYSYSIDTPRS